MQSVLTNMSTTMWFTLEIQTWSYISRCTRQVAIKGVDMGRNLKEANNWPREGLFVLFFKYNALVESSGVVIVESSRVDS